MWKGRSGELGIKENAREERKEESTPLQKIWCRFCPFFGPVCSLLI